MAKSQHKQTGKLSLIATPIGNLGDITLRAINALQGADVIFAEDTRVTGKLLHALNIDAKQLRRLDENIMSEHVDEVAALIEDGHKVAYCTDAGMPGVSDPGAKLVASTQAHGLCVEVLPGASASSCAYVASGTANTSYYFGGFLPRKSGELKSLLGSLSNLDAALIFYESPKRLVSSLDVIASQFPYREVAVCRELTKLHEEIFRGDAIDVAEEFAARASRSGGIKGEIVIVIDGISEKELGLDADFRMQSATLRANELASLGETQKSITSVLIEEFAISKNDAYSIALSAKANT